jgi:hypothetical protein
MTTHYEIVKKLLDTKSVDFTAIGKVVAELGPSLSLSDDPGDFICGTMRGFIHIYNNPFIGGGPVENLGQLREATAALR